MMVVAVATLVSGCASRPGWSGGEAQHIVRRGETLSAIAFRYDRDPAELARWNDLGDGSLIYPGQVIRLDPPPGGASATQASRSKPLPAIPADPPPAWRWPAAGGVGVEFGGKPGPGTGLLIDGRVGQPVRAAASGTVVYAGSGLIGYGQLIILKHNDTYLSAYGYNATLLVKEGQEIATGQQIATMGEGPERKPRLHFEIRRNGKPVDPRQFLPAR